MFTKTTLATGALVGVLSLAVTGAAAFAAFQPAALTEAAVASARPDTASNVAAERDGPATAIAAILERLVQNGTITAAQKEAILAALREAKERKGDGDRKPGDGKGKDKGKHLQPRAIRGDLWKAASDYLGVERGQLMRQMKDGKSLGQIADATSGKSRAGLIAAMVAAANAEIDDAVAKGKLTAEQAAKAKERVPGAVEKFVDATRTKPAR
jgi:polyhydroxyalkanoate synthesis regulator phasin